MSYGNEQNERDYSNPATGKRYGETEREHYAREREELMREQREGALRDRDRRSETGGGSSGGGDLTFPGQKTSFAKFILYLGWGLLFARLVLRITEASGDFLGVSLQQLTFWGGLLCLAFVYLAQVIWVIIMLVVLWFFYQAGSTPDGFQFSAVPLKMYLVVIGAVALLPLMRTLLSRD